MKLKRLILGLLAVSVSSIAFAQTVLSPYLTGTNSEHRREIYEIGMLRLPLLNNALTALAGGAQAGTQLTLGYNRVSTVTSSGDSSQLPVITGGVIVMVTNSAASNSMNVFPPTGGIINAGAANAAFAVAAGKTAIFIQAVDTFGATFWYAVLTA